MKGNAVIVADSPEAGISLEKTLAREAQFRVVARFNSPIPLLEAARAQAKKPACEWDLVLMVLSAADWNGVDTGRRLREILPEVPILLFTTLSASDAPDAGATASEAEDLPLRRAARELRRLADLAGSNPIPQDAPPNGTSPRPRPCSLDFYSKLFKKKRS